MASGGILSLFEEDSLWGAVRDEDPTFFEYGEFWYGASREPSPRFRLVWSLEDGRRFFVEGPQLPEMPQFLEETGSSGVLQQVYDHAEAWDYLASLPGFDHFIETLAAAELAGVRAGAIGDPAVANDPAGACGSVAPASVSGSSQQGGGEPSASAASQATSQVQPAGDLAWVADDGVSGSSGAMTVTMSGGNNPPVAGNDGPITTSEDTPVTVSVTVAPVDDWPQARQDYAVTAEGTSVTIDLLANDSDAEGAVTLVYVQPTTSGGGTVVDNGDGTATYTPWYWEWEYQGQVFGWGFTGFDSFSYQIQDTTGNAASSSVTVYVTSDDWDDPPWARNDEATTDEDTSATIDVLGNDFDAEGPVTLTGVSSTSMAGGTVSDNGDGTVTYTPAQDFCGFDYLSYSIEDSQGAATWASVNLTVEPVNDPPVAENDLAYTGQDCAVTVYVLNSDSDVEQTQLIVADAGGATNGSLWFNSTGVTYTPDPSFVSGTDTFSYTVKDGQGGADTATVTITMVDVTDYVLEWEDVEGTWVVVADAEVSWSHDHLRWTAELSPENLPQPSWVDFMAKRWADRDNPAVPWWSFASGPPDAPVEGNPGAGEWAITPAVHFHWMMSQSGFTAKMATPERKIVAEITSIQWVAHSNPDEAAELVDEGGGTKRLYPDAPQPGQSARTKVDFLITVEPNLAGIDVVARACDVDDASDHDGPIDADPEADPEHPNLLPVNNVDNFCDPSGCPPADPWGLFFTGSTDANGQLRATFNVESWIQPGNNWRIAAGARESEVGRVKPLAADSASRLFYDHNNDGWYDTTDWDECVLDEFSFPFGGHGIAVTPLLTLWRKLHVEVDSMGEEPEGTTFEEDDLLRGDVPDPDTSGLAGPFGDAFIDVVIGTIHDDSHTPWKDSFSSVSAMYGYMVGADGERGTKDDESAAYWSVYVIGIYEDCDPLLDNDPNQELARDGVTGNSEPEWSAVNTEVQRDLAAGWGWDEAEKQAVARGVVVHEIGHQFELQDDPQDFPTHVMFDPDTPAKEDLLPQVPLQFHESDIRKIRRDVVSP